MTIELALCIGFMLLSAPVAKEFMFHYAGFALCNLAFIGYASADASVLAMAFLSLAIMDITLAIAWRRPALAFCGFVSFLLYCEQLLNGDWLLNHALYLSLATNSAIGACLIREYLAWMHGRRQPF